MGTRTAASYENRRYRGQTVKSWIAATRYACKGKPRIRAIPILRLWPDRTLVAARGRTHRGAAMNIRCDRCGREPDEVAPMLKDVVWQHIARKNETLCRACAHERIRRRFGRKIRFADLLPCAFNITWCSAFEELIPWDEPLPPDELERWQRAFATAERLIVTRRPSQSKRSKKPWLRRRGNWQSPRTRPSCRSMKASTTVSFR